MTRSIIFFIVMLFGSGCALPRFDVQTTYINIGAFASSIVGSPDPNQDCPPIGQRLLVTWRLDNETYRRESPYFTLTIRFYNRQQETVTVALSSSKGSYLYQLENDDYLEKQGILAYKAELWGSSGLIDARYHHMWVDIISIGESCQE